MNTKSRLDTLQNSSIRQFLCFISVAYLTQGIAQHFCLIAQPLDYHMLKTLGMNAADVATMLSLLMIPWMIKPLYGLVSDIVPLRGYRRKSYICLAYFSAGAGYISAGISGSFAPLFLALFCTAVGMAVGTTIVCGLTLAVGRPDDKTRTYQSVQAVSYYCASIGSFLVGGVLCSSLLPQAALQVACFLAALPCFVASLASWKLIEEEKVTVPGKDFAKVRETLLSLKSNGILVVALFLCCWSFSPGFGTPLYFYETNVLGFSQLFIGQLGAINSLGMIVGAFFFLLVFSKYLGVRLQALLAIALGTLSTLGYFFLDSQISAILLEFCRGFANVVAILTIYGLAADVSPRDIESTTIALLISAYNIAEQLSNVLGANLYTYTFSESFPKLIAVSALATLACVLLVPLLPQKRAHS